MATKPKAARKPAPKKKKTDADVVRDSAAAPHASHAGTEHVLESEGLPVRIRVIENARAVIEVDKHDPLTQAELQSVGKLINQAAQETY